MKKILIIMLGITMLFATSAFVACKVEDSGSHVHTRVVLLLAMKRLSATSAAKSTENLIPKIIQAQNSFT